jgi:hypothetical protein
VQVIVNVNIAHYSIFILCPPFLREGALSVPFSLHPCPALKVQLQKGTVKICALIKQCKMWLDELVLVSACIFCITFCFLCYTCITAFKAVRVTVEKSEPEQISIRCIWYSKGAYKSI